MPVRFGNRTIGVNFRKQDGAPSVVGAVSQPLWVLREDDTTITVEKGRLCGSLDKSGSVRKPNLPGLEDL